MFEITIVFLVLAWLLKVLINMESSREEAEEPEQLIDREWFIYDLEYRCGRQKDCRYCFVNRMIPKEAEETDCCFAAMDDETLEKLYVKMRKEGMDL